MKEVQQTKVLMAIAPVAIKDNADFVTQVIDTADADYLEFLLLIGVTDIAVATLKIMESDVKTNATTLGGTPSEVLDVTTKPSATDDGEAWALGVNLRNPRKRYIQLQAKAGDGAAGTFLAAVCVLMRTGENATDAAGRECGYVEYA